MAFSPTRLLAALAFATAGVPAAGEPASGRIDLEGAQVEVLGEPLPAGKRIELPEGYLQVEEDGPEDGEVGTFTVASADAFPATARPEAAPAERPAPAPAEANATTPVTPAAPAGAPCRAERTAYLRQLWRESGIDFDDPVALAEGLEAGGSGPATAYGWFALQTDAFRNLSWSEALKARARDLVRCVDEARGASR